MHEAKLEVRQGLGVKQGFLSAIARVCSRRKKIAYRGAITQSAIFASNDDMAAAAIAVAHRQHLDVPRGT